MLPSVALRIVRVDVSAQDGHLDLTSVEQMKIIYMHRILITAIRIILAHRFAVFAVALFLFAPALYALTRRHLEISDVHAKTNFSVDVYDVSRPTRDYGRCVRLATTPSPLVCVHGPTVDRYVSAAILAGGVWEANVVRCFQHLLNVDKTLGVVDIGANVGQYTLLAAAMGRRVVAVEARLVHVQMMQRAVVDGRLGARITLVHNAVSDRREWAALYARRDNPGATRALRSARPCRVPGRCPPRCVGIFILVLVYLLLGNETSHLRFLHGVLAH